MLLLRRLKETEDFSDVDRVIASYILEHPDCILHNNAKELALLTYTSAPSIVRFCKKLGMQGYPDFRFRYIAEYSESRNEVREQINPDASMSDILRLLALRYELVARNSADRINKAAMAQVIHQFRQADTIDFYATGINYGVAMAACIRFSNLGYHAQVQLGVNKHYIMNANPDNRKRVLSFVISHTGSNESVLEVARFLKQYGMPMVHLGRGGNELYDLADTHILWDNDHFDENFDNLSYPVSLMFILDAIYIELANLQIRQKLKNGT